MYYIRFVLQKYVFHSQPRSASPTQSNATESGNTRKAVAPIGTGADEATGAGMLLFVIAGVGVLAAVAMVGVWDGKHRPTAY